MTPPLRARREDIPLLADHFAKRSGRDRARFSREAIDVLTRYAWPGNVRELENAVLHAVSMADDVIYPEHLPERVRLGRPAVSAPRDAEGSPDEQHSAFEGGPTGFPTLAEMETRYVKRVLESTNGNKQAAAKILDIDRKTLSRIVARNGDSGD